MLNSDFRDILFAFCEEKVEFMLVGAYAVAAHGLPRATGDITDLLKNKKAVGRPQDEADVTRLEALEQRL